MNEKSWFRRALQWIGRVENALDYDPIAAAHKRIDRLGEAVAHLTGAVDTETSGLNIVAKSINLTREEPVRGADRGAP